MIVKKKLQNVWSVTTKNVSSVSIGPLKTMVFAEGEVTNCFNINSRHGLFSHIGYRGKASLC